MKFSKICLLAVLFTGAIRADVLVGFDFTGSGGTSQGGNNNNFAAGTGTFSSTLATTPTIGRTGVSWATLNNSFNSNGWSSNTGTDTSSLSLANSSYISFTTTAADNYDLTLTSLQYAINGTNTAPNAGVWAYSIDGGSLVFQTSFTLSASTASLSTWTFDSSIEVSAGSSITFAFFAYGTTAINSVNGPTNAGAVRIINISGNDLILNGTAASVVPEPATYALIFGGGAALIVFARRRKGAVQVDLENS
jgi:hypothetical protein